MTIDTEKRRATWVRASRRYTRNHPDRVLAIGRKKRKKRAENSQCIECGRDLHPDFDEGMSKCVYCREMRREKLWR
jgi:hypothetical protein